MTAKRKRWAVWRDTTMEAHHDNPWIGAPERHWVYRYAGHAFPTHAEALAHADRMARTVEVTLLRRTNDITNYLGVRYNPTTRCVEIYSHFHDHKYPIHYSEAEGVALALLAHHYRNETP